MHKLIIKVNTVIKDKCGQQKYSDLAHPLSLIMRNEQVPILTNNPAYIHMTLYPPTQYDHIVKYHNQNKHQEITISLHLVTYRKYIY